MWQSERATARSEHIHQASHRFLESLKSSTQSSAPSDIPPRDMMYQLHDLASRKLRHIVKSRGHNDEYLNAGEAELIAAKELLERSQ